MAKVEPGGAPILKKKNEFCFTSVAMLKQTRCEKAEELDSCSWGAALKAVSGVSL